jgi:hypothetical protein
MVTLRCGGTTARHGGSARFRELVFTPLEISTRSALRRLNTSCATSSVAALDYLSDGDADVLVVLACVRLRAFASASIEQRLNGGHARRRGAALEPQTPVSVRMASAVCARAKDRISARMRPTALAALAVDSCR